MAGHVSPDRQKWRQVGAEWWQVLAFILPPWVIHMSSSCLHQRGDSVSLSTVSQRVRGARRCERPRAGTLSWCQHLNLLSSVLEQNIWRYLSAEQKLLQSGRTEVTNDVRHAAMTSGKNGA